MIFTDVFLFIPAIAVNYFAITGILNAIHVNHVNHANKIVLKNIH